MGLADNIFASFAFLRVARQECVDVYGKSSCSLLQHPIEQIIVFMKVVKARVMAKNRHEEKKRERKE